jgi:hypothetical protein
VQDIDTALVLEILEPIWHDKPETASRLRGRIETVLDFASARGLRQGDNPARWRGHIAHMLPAPTKVRAIKHHAAMPYGELPAFMTALRARPSTKCQSARIPHPDGCEGRRGGTRQAVGNRRERRRVEHPGRAHEGRQGASRAIVGDSVGGCEIVVSR